MLALKKKREAEQKQAEAAAASSSSNGGTTAVAPQKLSLLGVGGKKQAKNGDSTNTVKKRTPGEIRIQKGAFVLFVVPVPHFQQSVKSSVLLFNGATTLLCHRLFQYIRVNLLLSPFPDIFTSDSILLQLSIDYH
jgi:hypothetical protein